MIELSPEELYILIHLRRANADYANAIAKRLKFPRDEVMHTLRRLEEASLVERSSGSAIKKSEARFKLTLEVRKHHLYFTLSRKGEHLLRSLLKKGIALYFKERYSEEAFELLEFLKKAGCENHLHISKALSLPVERTKALLETLREERLVDLCRAKVLKRKHRRAKPKKETRTHHKYYRVTRLYELIVREGL
jgi:predicted transcriptional regulator